MNKHILYTVITSVVMILPSIAHADWNRGDRYDRYSEYSHRDFRHHPHNRFEFFVDSPRPVYYRPQPVYRIIEQPQVIYITAPPVAPPSFCREFNRKIYIGGRAQQGYGTACLQPDGSWQFKD
jgi:hypothetical protein